jgi:hypothetical protein
MMTIISVMQALHGNRVNSGGITLIPDLMKLGPLVPWPPGLDTPVIQPSWSRECEPRSQLEHTVATM